MDKDPICEAFKQKYPDIVAACEREDVRWRQVVVEEAVKVAERLRQATSMLE